MSHKNVSQTLNNNVVYELLDGELIRDVNESRTNVTKRVQVIGRSIIKINKPLGLGITFTYVCKGFVSHPLVIVYKRHIN